MYVDTWQTLAPEFSHPLSTSRLPANCVNVWMYLTISYWFQSGLMDSNKVLCYPEVGQLHKQAPTAGSCSRRGAPARHPAFGPSVLTDRWVHEVGSPYGQITKKGSWQRNGEMCHYPDRCLCVTGPQTNGIKLETLKLKHTGQSDSHLFVIMLFYN